MFFPVSYPFLIYSNYSACSLPHFCCPFSYTFTELCIFLGFTASHLLQLSCSSFCQQLLIMPFIVNPSMLFSLFISLFTFILPIALTYYLAFIVVYAYRSISALHAINAPCSVIDCHFILLIVWFMPVIHSMLLIYTQLLLASCLSFGSCSSCHDTWPAFRSFYLCSLSASHSYFIHADCLVCVCYAIPVCQFILSCHSLVLVNQFVQFMIIILLGLIILPLFVLWVVLTLFDLCSLCSLCLSCNLPYLLAPFWLSCCLVHIYHSIHGNHLMHACHSFLAHPSVHASHCIPAFHLGHVHLFNYASLWIMLVNCFMLLLQFCLSFCSCLLCAL